MPPFLIVNADDFNLTEGVSRGILEAHRHGIVTSTTMMTNLPGLNRSADLARANPGLGLGIHLNLTHGRPVLPVEAVASLVDDSGGFIRDRGRVGERGTPSEIRRELSAQIERFMAVVGHRPSHLDTHHHVHRHPRVFEIVLDLAVELGVPVRALTPEMLDRSRHRHLPAVDRVVGDVGQDAYWTRERLLMTVEGLPAGVTELMCHPGYADVALSVSSYGLQREVELRTLCDPGIKWALGAAGVQCISYRDLGGVPAGR